MSLSARTIAYLVLPFLLPSLVTGCAAGTPERPVPAAAPARPTAHELVANAVEASTKDDKPVLLVLTGDDTASGTLADLLARPRVASALTEFHVVRVPVAAKAGAEEAAARGIDLARSRVPALAVLVGGQPVYAGADHHFARPARLTDRQVVHWLHRWS